MPGFHEVRFPLRLSLSTSGGPERRTDIVNLTNGRESRNRRWRAARRSYDAGSGVRSIDDLYEVAAFFEARSGALYGFRFRDPFDDKSCPPGESVSAMDQLLGTGDGTRTDFQLLKTYADAGGGVERVIAKPVAGTVVVSVAGSLTPPWDFACDPATGVVVFSTPPAAGAAVRAGFVFDVPVRFATDRIDISLQSFKAGRIPSILLIEITP
ncbi:MULTISPECIES: DUF2460 domain-containing protein [Rhizobium]|uniref:DUF2460 domain-containing protein n=1 Tax=Rhizobium TaxID=379 RepID=UPI00140CB3EC|nr:MULTISPECIES: DUF2460 domain-containing protein [Rhizobium]MDG3574846.1 DUF2460 domain-containing protein [Rhizobium sp. YJ-22]